MVKLIDHLIKNCSGCSNTITIKYNYPQKRYSQQNQWGYWTEQEKDKEKYLCNNCLIDLYKNKKRRYQKEVTNPGKRKIMTALAYKLKNK